MPSYMITGANRGLGLEFVRQLTTTSTTGPHTILATVRSLANTDVSALEALAKNTTNSSTLTIHECDTSTPSSIRAFTASLPSSLTSLSTVINNAGINSHPSQSALTMTPEVMHAHIDTNVLGPALLTQSLLPLLQKGSVVVNVTSGMGSFGKAIVADAKTTYSVSKAALNMLSAHQAAELKGRGIKVLAMDPGWVKTVSLALPVYTR